ncbi:MAG TPA: hypothetical protein VH817_22655 [Thermoleophilaceae bacterium]
MRLSGRLQRGLWGLRERRADELHVPLDDLEVPIGREMHIATWVEMIARRQPSGSMTGID